VNFIFWGVKRTQKSHFLHLTVKFGVPIFRLTFSIHNGVQNKDARLNSLYTISKYQFLYFEASSENRQVFYKQKSSRPDNFQCRRPDTAANVNPLCRCNVRAEMALFYALISRTHINWASEGAELNSSVERAVSLNVDFRRMTPWTTFPQHIHKSHSGNRRIILKWIVKKPMWKRELYSSQSGHGPTTGFCDFWNKSLGSATWLFKRNKLY